MALESQKPTPGKIFLSHNSNSSKWLLKALSTVAMLLLAVCGYWVQSFYSDFSALQEQVDQMHIELEDVKIRSEMVSKLIFGAMQDND